MSGGASTAAPTLPEADGLPQPQRSWAILAISLAVGMVVLDGTIVNVALPTIGRQLGATPAESIWIVNAYQLAITVALLPLASLGDKIGHRRVYITGLAVFTVGALACALSRTLPELIAARVLQGFGGAGVMSMNAALLRFTYPAPRLGRGIGLNAVVIATAAAGGPTAASAILAVASWPWLFAAGVPLGAAALILSFRSLPRTPGSGAALDFFSAALSATAFGGVILGAEDLSRGEVGSGLAKISAGLFAGGVLFTRERARAAPMIPLDLFRLPHFARSVATSSVAYTAQMLALVAVPFHFQEALGRTAVETGLLMMPWPLGVGVVAPLAGRLADRCSSASLGAAGLAVFAAGLLSLALLPPDAGTADIVWRMCLCGLGFGFFQSPNNRAILASSPRSRSGAAGGVLATARLLGQTAGAATLAMLFHAEVGEPTRWALLVATGAAVAASLGSLWGVRQLRRRSGG